MGIHDYHLVTRWLVPGTPQEVSDALGDPADLPRWWPSACREAEVTSPGAQDGVGRVVRVRTRGWLPYTLDWTLRVTEARGVDGIAFEAEGDVRGRGSWSFEPAGAWVGVTFDWNVEARKPLLRLLAPIFRPALEANHRWAMRRGEESLKLELERRRAASEWEKERIPSPPGPATRSAWILLGMGAGALALLASATETARRRRRRRRSWWRRLRG